MANQFCLTANENTSDIMLDSFKIIRYSQVIGNLLSGTRPDHQRIPLISSCSKQIVSCRHASHSSHSWLERQRKDIYKKMARYDHYRARSAYKLIQIDDKYKFLKPGKIVIEAGAAPGSWTQVICERLQLTDMSAHDSKTKPGLCIAVDLAAIEPVDGAICIGNADFTSPFTQGSILTWLDSRQADCVLSDMAPNCSGQKSYDHTKAVILIKSILPFTLQVLKPGDGVFVFKLWDGSETNELVDRLKMHFRHVHRVKPPASRGDSAEVYIVCRKFIGSEPLKRDVELKCEVE